MPAAIPFQLPPNPLAGDAGAARHVRLGQQRRRSWRPGGRHARPDARDRRTAPAAAPPPGRTSPLPDLRQDGPGGLRLLRLLRHAHGAGSRRARGRHRAPRRCSWPGSANAPAGRRPARPPHPHPPRRLGRRRPSAARRREHHRPRPGAAVRRRRLPVAAPRRAHRSAPNGLTIRDLQSLNGVFLKITARRRSSRVTSSASARSCCASR